MHELSLACSVVELVEKELALHGGGSVRCIETVSYTHLNMAGTYLLAMIILFLYKFKTTSKYIVL